MQIYIFFMQTFAQYASLLRAFKHLKKKQKD